jgi:hypothetical protein
MLGSTTGLLQSINAKKRPPEHTTRGALTNGGFDWMLRLRAAEVVETEEERDVEEVEVPVLVEVRG